jgi:hypothetical protein
MTGLCPPADELVVGAQEAFSSGFFPPWNRGFYHAA